MCGIVGYTGGRAALPILMGGLHSLEYRGYDSAGVAFVDGQGLMVVRRTGRVSELDRALEGAAVDATSGVAHTRWATCGVPSEANSHPHCDCTGSVAVVHNGIIENHRDLRGTLKAGGHTFTSETDSEILAHLIEVHLRNGSTLLEATRLSAIEAVGSLALGVVSQADPGRLIGVRIDSPLVVGIGDGENFLASDMSALLAHTRRAIFLENGSMVELTPSSVRVFDMAGNEMPLEVKEVAWDREAAQKSGYPDFMLKEIHEQPEALRETLRARTAAGGALDLTEIRLSPEELEAIEQVFVVACGSSFHAGLVAEYAMERWARLPVKVDVASEFRYRDPILSPRTLVIGISQSGETADTLAAMRHAREQGAKLIAVTNVVGSTITRECDSVLYTRAGPEVGVAATKTLTTQMAAMWLLSLWAAESKGRMADGDARAILEQMRALPDQIESMLDDGTEILRAADEVSRASAFLFIGRGVGYPVALEGALKLKEISYLHAEGFAAGEMKHGPIALVEPGVTVVGIAPQGQVHPKLVSNLEEAKARGGHILAVANKGDEEVLAVADEVILVPETAEMLSAALTVVPLQLLAYHVAKRRGCEPDRPRNLAKSVTVE